MIMAEIEARREARRRRILENSEKRLSKISGVEQKSTKIELDGILRNTHEDDANSVYTDQNKSRNEIIERTSSIKLSSQNEDYHQNPMSVQTDTSKLDHNIQNTEMNGRSKNVYKFVIPIFLSFILVIFDLLKIDVKSIHLNKIFIPLIIYELIEYFSTDFLGNPTPNILISLLLTNIKSRYSKSYINYLFYFLKVMQDVMVYFFLFTISYEILLFVLL